MPFAVNGFIDVSLEDKNETVKRVALSHIQLEQDSGKTVRANSPHEVLVDLNRAGTALLEIVTAPDMR